MRLIIILLALAVATPVDAARGIFRTNPQFPSAQEVPQKEWVGQVAVGYQENSGNTENSHLNGKILLGYADGSWRHTVNFMGNRTTDAVGTTGERYALAGKTDYRLNGTDYLFITAQVENDRFAGFDRRMSEAVGYGRHLFETERHRLNGELGIGARQTRFVDGTRDNDAIGRLALNWLFGISENTEFTSRLIVESGSGNTFTESINALKTNLTGSVFSSISYTVKHNSTVPGGRQNKDTFMTIQIEYRF